MKVLHIITGLGVGGAELQLRSVIQHSRHDCDVVTLYNAGPVADMFGEDGVRVRNLEMVSNRQLSVLPRLWRLIRQGQLQPERIMMRTATAKAQLKPRLAGRTPAS